MQHRAYGVSHYSKPFTLKKGLRTSINYLASAVMQGKVTFAELKKFGIPALVLRNAKVLYCNLKGIKPPEGL